MMGMMMISRHKNKTSRTVRGEIHNSLNVRFVHYIDLMSTIMNKTFRKLSFEQSRDDS